MLVIVILDVLHGKFHMTINNVVVALLDIISGLDQVILEQYVVLFVTMAHIRIFTLVNHHDVIDFVFPHTGTNLFYFLVIGLLLFLFMKSDTRMIPSNCLP